jgi:hypothetical protein
MTVTLAEIEQETARRVGPFYVLSMYQQTPSTANFERAYFPGLRSSVEQDLVTNLWLLRRGIDYLGTPVVVDSVDRQRTVAVYDPQDGSVQIDRPWSVAPAPGEVCEFHHLDPEQQLRPAVRAGLRRCFFSDRYSMGNGFIFEADLTAALPWLTEPRWVWSVQLWSAWYGTPRDLPFVTFSQSGHVCIRVQAGGYPGFAGVNFAGEVHVILERPTSTWVNQMESVVGPTADGDMLEVDLDYAAAAGHIEAWHQFPARLQAAAAGGTQATQAMASLEFTRQARLHGPHKPDRWAFETLVGINAGSLTVVNA